MATLNQLRTAITSLLGHPNTAAVLQLNSNTRERAFECYIFALVLKAIRQAGGNITLFGINSGPNPDPIVFRGGSGHLSSTAQDFCYALCQLNGKEFEVHLDIEYLGNSEATHEVDVSIYNHRTADFVRANSGMLPSTRKLYGAIECKCYDSTLGTSLGRAFVGLLDDCGSLNIKLFATNGQNDGLAKYFSQSRRPQPFFDVSPSSPSNSDRLVSHIEQALRRWAAVI